MYYHVIRMKEEVFKSFRLDKVLSELAELMAAVEGLSFSEYIRRLVKKDIIEKSDFIKQKAKEIVDILSEIEKAPNSFFEERAKTMMWLYPLEGATLEHYITLEKMLATIEKLEKAGFEREYAEKVAYRYFFEEGENFKKALGLLASGMPETWARREARRAILKRMEEK